MAGKTIPFGQTLDIPAMAPPPGRRRKKKPALTPKQTIFAQCVATGRSFAEAWRTASGNLRCTAKHAANEGNRMAKRATVEAEIARIRKKFEVKTLLTMNDRCAILAEIAQDKKLRPGDRARAIDIYSRISGDQAPERLEVSGKDGGPVETTATTLIVARIPLRQRMAAMRAARAAAERTE